ncbi:MAG: S-layer family protein [Gammaproteobacteria bacterium]|nr:S-layer family protein [Gammaproteobacteria bacterium]
MLLDTNTINTGGANGVFTNEVLLGFATNDPLTDIAITNNTGDINVIADVFNSGGIAWDTTGSITLSGDLSSGAAGISLDASEFIVLNATVTTGNVTTTGTLGLDTAVSGSISTSAGTTITGNGSGRLITGAASVDGTATGDDDTATSGSITLSAGGAIELAAADALTIGNASVVDGAGSTTATAGSITVSTADKISSDGTSGGVDLKFGTATGADVLVYGSVSVTTDGGAGDAGGIFLTSGEALRVGALSTAAATVQNVSISTTGGAALTVNDVVHTLTGDSVVFDAVSGTLTLANLTNDFNIGTGTLTLRGDEIDLTGGADSVDGAGGAVVLEAGQASTIVGVAGGTGTLDLSTTDLGALQNGFTQITIGRADGTGTLTFGDGAGGGYAFNDPVTLQAGGATGDISMEGPLSVGTAGDSIELLAGREIIDANTGTDVTGDVISLIAGTDIGINGGDPLEVAGVEVLSIDVGGSFDVAGGSTLTDLSIGVDAGQAADDSYTLTGFGGGLVLGIQDTGGLTDDLLISGTTATSALNISIATDSGDILLDDAAATAAAVNLFTATGDITLTASTGNIFDNNAPGTEDVPATDFNLRTDAGSTITLNAPGNSVGGALTSEDIDISGTTSVAIDANFSKVSGDTDLTELSLTLDPSGTVNYNVASGNTIVMIGEDGSNNIQINEISNNTVLFDVFLKALSGDIVINNSVTTGIFDIGNGDVTLEAVAGDILELNTTTDASITTGGLVTLIANAVGGSLANQELDIAEATPGGGISLAPKTTGQIFLISDGALTITDPNAIGLTVGGGSIAANSPETIAGDMTITGDMTFTAAADGATNDDDLTITSNATLTLDSTIAPITLTLEAGDDIIFNNTTAAAVDVSSTLGQQAHTVVLTADLEGGGADGEVGGVRQNTGGLTAVDNTGDSTLTLNITAGNNIGQLANANDLDVEVSTLTASTTGGGIFIDETDAVTIGAAGLSTEGGEIDISAGGTFADGGNSIETQGVGDGGNVTLAVSGAGGAINLTGTLNTSGAAGTSADGFDAGTIMLTTSDGNVAVDTVTADGGAGDTGFDGGDAGNVTFTAGGATRSLTLNGVLSAVGGAGTVAGANGIAMLSAADGVTLNDDFTAGATTIDADTDFGDDVGTLTLASDVALNTSSATLDITADDISIDTFGMPATINAGATTITVSDGGSIGLGNGGTLVDLRITGAELEKITASQLTLAGTDSSITVDGVTAANSNNVGTVVLDARNDTAVIAFNTAVSIFNALTAFADDGITVDFNITTDTGALSLDGDFDDLADGTDSISIAAGITLSSAGGMTLSATQGDISGAGDLTLTFDSDNNAAETLAINDALTTVGALSINGGTGTNDVVDLNADVTAGTTLTIENAATVDLAGSVDLRTTSGALSVVTNVTAINLSGANGTTNLIDGNGDAAFSNVTAINLSGANGTTNLIDGNGDALVRLANITDTNNPNLTVTSEGDLTLAGASLGSGTHSFTADNDGDTVAATLLLSGAP